MQGKYSLADSTLMPAIDLSSRVNNEYYQSRCLLTYAFLLIELGCFKDARDCLDLVKDTTHDKELSIETVYRYNLFSYMEAELSGRINADNYIKKLEGVDREELLADYEKIQIMFVITDSYIKNKDLDNARRYLKIICKMLIDLHNPSFEALYFHKMSRVYFFDKSKKRSNKQKAFECRQKAREIIKESQVPRINCYIHYAYARYLKSLNKLETAKKEYKEAIKIIVDLARNISDKKTKCSFIAHPRIWEIYNEYKSLCSGEKELQELLEIERTLSIQEIIIQKGAKK